MPAVGTTDQDLSIRVEKLTTAGCTVVREEKVSGTSREGRIMQLKNEAPVQSLGVLTSAGLVSIGFCSPILAPRRFSVFRPEAMADL
jgi:hypothetical protein